MGHRLGQQTENGFAFCQLSFEFADYLFGAFLLADPTARALDMIDVTGLLSDGKGKIPGLSFYILFLSQSFYF